jgi:periplasmic protein TonB
MKSCPTCQRQYEDETLKFCLEDGSPLADQLNPTRAGSAADATLHLPGSFAQPTPPKPTERAAAPRSTMTSIGSPGAPVMSGPADSGEHRRSGALLWVIGALIIGVAAVAVAFIVTRNRTQDTNAANQTATPSPAPTTKEPEVAAAPATTTTNEVGAATPAPSQSRSATPSPERKPPGEKEVLAKQQEETVETTNTKRPEPPPTEKVAPRGPVSGGVLNGKAVRLVTPTYPAMARAAHASGEVKVQVLIDENGNVTSAHAVSGHPLLQSSAVNAARASKFEPTTLSGQAVKVSGVIVYNFTAQ